MARALWAAACAPRCSTGDCGAELLGGGTANVAACRHIHPHTGARTLTGDTQGHKAVLAVFRVT